MQLRSYKYSRVLFQKSLHGLWMANVSRNVLNEFGLSPHAFGWLKWEIACLAMWDAFASLSELYIRKLYFPFKSTKGSWILPIYISIITNYTIVKTRNNRKSVTIESIAWKTMHCRMVPYRIHTTYTSPIVITQNITNWWALCLLVVNCIFCYMYILNRC